jgi:prepilin peptidase CpaA
MGLDLNSGFVAAFVALVVYGAITDVDRLKIPNWISVSLVLLFTFYLAFGKHSLPAFQHIGVATAVLIVGFAAFTLGHLGAGDVKLMAAVALWAGPSKILMLALLTTLSGAALALLILFGMFYLRAESANTIRTWGLRLLPRWVRQGITPYGVAICIGALASVPPLLL